MHCPAVFVGASLFWLRLVRIEVSGTMGSERIFVGREEELERFGDLLADPRGQAVVVVGKRGMGKTWLVEEMAEGVV